MDNRADIWSFGAVLYEMLTVRQLFHGGAVVTLCDAPVAGGGSWGADGNIIAALNRTGGLSLVSAAGGKPKPVTELNEDAGESSHRRPQVLPGGKAVLFTAGNSIEVQSIETGESKTFYRGGHYGRHLPVAHARTIRARCASSCADLGRRAQLPSVSRSNPLPAAPDGSLPWQPVRVRTEPQRISAIRLQLGS